MHHSKALNVVVTNGFDWCSHPVDVIFHVLCFPLLWVRMEGPVSESSLCRKYAEPELWETLDFPILQSEVTWPRTRQFSWADFRNQGNSFFGVCYHGSWLCDLNLVYFHIPRVTYYLLPFMKLKQIQFHQIIDHIMRILKFRHLNDDISHLCRKNILRI